MFFFLSWRKPNMVVMEDERKEHTHILTASWLWTFDVFLFLGRNKFKLDFVCEYIYIFLLVRQSCSYMRVTISTNSKLCLWPQHVSYMLLFLPESRLVTRLFGWSAYNTAAPCNIYIMVNKVLWGGITQQNKSAWRRASEENTEAVFHTNTQTLWTKYVWEKISTVEIGQRMTK